MQGVVSHSMCWAGWVITSHHLSFVKNASTGLYCMETIDDLLFAVFYLYHSNKNVFSFRLKLFVQASSLMLWGRQFQNFDADRRKALSPNFSLKTEPVSPQYCKQTNKQTDIHRRKQYPPSCVDRWN